MGGDKKNARKRGNDDGKKEAWMDDDIELANKTVQQKSSKSFVRLDKESSDEDEDESEDEEEALMDVSSSLSSSESSDDDEEEEEEEFLEDSEDDEAGLLRAMKAQKKKLEYARLRNRAEHSDDSDEEKDSEDSDDVGVRGKRKQDFYGDEEIDHEDAEEEEDRKDEEAAARAAQKQRAGKMRLGDFGLEDEEDDSEEEASSSSEEEEEEEDSEEMTLQQKAQRSKLGAKKTPLEEEEEEEKGKQKKKKRSKTSDGGSGGVVVEALDDDEKRAKREKLENASANADEAEEVRALAEELQKTLAEVETNVEPIVKSAKRGEYLTEEGISYLDTKYMLLLSYCVNLTFYLLMKSEGKSIKDHPVVMRLVEIRSYIEKLRPIDKKLHYQVCFLLICLFPRSCVCMQRAKNIYHANMLSR